MWERMGAVERKKYLKIHAGEIWEEWVCDIWGRMGCERERKTPNREIRASSAAGSDLHTTSESETRT